MTLAETVNNNKNIDNQTIININKMDGDINEGVSTRDFIELLSQHFSASCKEDNDNIKTTLFSSLQNLSSEYYNLFVTENEPYNKNFFTVLKEQALTKYIDSDLKQKYATLHTPEIISKIKTFPSLFMNENEFYAKASETQTAYYGIVNDIKVESNGIKIYFLPLCLLSQIELNKFSSFLGFENKKGEPELNYPHWTIKKINLCSTLKSLGFKIVDVS